MTRLTRVLGWAVILGLFVPVLHTAWVSFTPGSALAPPTGEWSGRWYRAFLEDRRWTAAAGRSFLVAGLASVVCLLAAVPAAYALSRGPFRGRRLLTVGILLPACLPPAALGMGALPLFHLTGLWGSIHGLVLTHAALGLPMAVLIVRSHLTDHISTLEAAARGLGASRGQVLWRVTLPLLRPAIAAAAVAVFALSLNESLVTLFLATPASETVPAVTWPKLRDDPSPLVAVAAVATASVGTLGVAAVLRVVRPTGAGAG